jgi:hypothetical protein
MGWRGPSLIEELLGATQPPTHRRHQGGIEQQMHRQSHRGAGRGDGLAGDYQSCVGPLPGFDRHIEVPRAVGGVGKQRQIGIAELAARVCVLEQVECRRPVANRCGGMRTLESPARCALAHRAPPICRRLPR